MEGRATGKGWQPVGELAGKTPAPFSKRGTRWLSFLCPFVLKHLRGNKILRRLLSPRASSQVTKQKGCQKPGHIFIEVYRNVSLSSLRAEATRSLTCPAMGRGDRALGVPSARGGGSWPHSHGPEAQCTPRCGCSPPVEQGGLQTARDFALLFPRVDNCPLKGAAWTSKG